MITRNCLLRVLLILGVLLMLAAPVTAQDAAQDAAQEVINAEFPTVAALETTILPPRDRIDLAARLRGIVHVAATPSASSAAQVGDRASFTVSNDDAYRSITATLRVAGEHIVLWVEDGARINDADLEALAQRFDDVIYPTVRDLWGSEAIPGVDGDPRVYGLFAHGLGATTAAYFASDHTYPREVVPTSNEHEMFFFNLDAIGAHFSLLEVESIVAHEFQHMIRNNLQSNEETWLNEGLSSFTQYYLYDEFDWSILSFLGAPDTQLNNWDDDPYGRAANYGASVLFLIYLYERYGIDFMQALSADPSPRGLQGVDDVLRAHGEPGVNEFFADWVLANFLTDTDYGDGRYGYETLPIIAPLPIETVSTYPASYKHEVSQYAADYYLLANLSSAETLNIHLSAPQIASLIPTSATSGAYFWYSNRVDMSDTRLTRAFDLSDVETATLDYRLWVDTEEFWDYGYVMVSDDDGATWDILETPYTTDQDPQGTAYGTGYTGMSGGWLEESLSLDAYVGDTILVRFEMITDDAVTRHGMALDDVRIDAIGYSADFEADGGGWEAEGWLWTDNRLPQQVWLQVMQRDGGDIVSVERWLLDGGGEDVTIALADGVDRVALAISPIAPVTTVPVPYSLVLGAE